MGINAIKCEKYAEEASSTDSGNVFKSASDFSIGTPLNGIAKVAVLLGVGIGIGYGLDELTSTNPPHESEKTAYIHNESQPPESGQIVPVVTHGEGVEPKISRYLLFIDDDTSLKPGDVVFMRHVKPGHYDDSDSPPQIVCKLGEKDIDWHHFNLDCKGEPLQEGDDPMYDWPNDADVYNATKVTFESNNGK